VRLIIISRDRHDYSPTLESLPKILRDEVEVWVPRDQYKLYKKSPIFSGIAIETWDPHIDCVPKKRRFLYENIKEEYMVIDDDLKLSAWDAKAQKYVDADSKPKSFVKGLEHSFALFDTHQNVGITNTFMASMKIKKDGALEHGGVPFCFAGFAKMKRRPKLDFKTFFFTDIAMPMQLLDKGHTVRTVARIAYSMRANKKLASTGTTPYRSEFLIQYSALALALQMRGYVFGLDHTGNNGGGWSLKKTFLRPNRERSDAWIREFCAGQGMRRPPKAVDLDLETPFQDLVAEFKASWANAQKNTKAK
jgi:hypothetical protein